MRILFIADGRSPTAINWISYFVEQGHEVHWVSTFPAEPSLNYSSFHIVPVSFSQVVKTKDKAAIQKPSLLKRITTPGMRTKIRQWAGPLTLGPAADKLQQIHDQIQPDLIHAMRIPFEGMLATKVKTKTPIILSIWGNDYTLHAKTTPLMNFHTRRSTKRADAISADCNRDIRLAAQWGFPEDRPTLMVPGAGGLQADIFHLPEQLVDSPIVVNPRGMRAYVRNEVFFQAIPIVLNEEPKAKFLCTTMQGDPQAERWVTSLGIEKSVDLMPRQSRQQMADLFRSAQVVVSPSDHDGSPNSLLEAMACGCFPIAGDIESIREWIKDGENGYLIDQSDPQDLANAILKAFREISFRHKVISANAKMIVERASYDQIMPKVENFYQSLLNQSP